MKRTALAFACLLLVNGAQAQIRTDASLGLPAKSLNGPNFLIPQTLGKLAGSNLFQSFQTFNLSLGETATFTTSTAGISNVISRVTGGDPSFINGQIRLQAVSGTPAFFFINPAGVLFGEGATIDVPGAFHVSTANSLRFADGSRLHADLGQASSFSSAAPEAFGFLGGARAAPIYVTDGAVLAPNRLQALSLTAGDMLIDNGVIAASGAIRLASVGEQMLDVPLTGAMPALTGQFFLVNGGLVNSGNVVDQDAGGISIGAGDITLDGSSSINSFTRAGLGKGADIELNAAGTVFLDNGAYLYSEVAWGGRGGAINIQAQDIWMHGGSRIYGGTQVNSSGHGGNILLQARRSLLFDGGAGIDVLVRAAGDGGEIRLESPDIVFTGGAFVLAGTGTGSTGRGGSLVLRATQDLILDQGGLVQAITGGAGDGTATRMDANNIFLAAKAYFLGGTEAGSSGRGGSLVLQAAQSLSIDTGAGIEVFAAGMGDGGLIQLGARDVILSAGGYLKNVTLAGGSGRGSDLFLNADRSLIIDGLDGEPGKTGVAVSTLGAADAGAVGIRAGSMSLMNGGYVTNGAKEGSGNGGDIRIQLDGALLLSGGGELLTFTTTHGASGHIHIGAQDILATDALSRIYSFASSASQAGDVELELGKTLSLNAGAAVSTSGRQGGNAGNIRIKAEQVALDGGAFITSGAIDALGTSGSVKIDAVGRIALSNGAYISANTFTDTSGGGIALSAGEIQLLSGAALSSAALDGRGNAGSIELSAAGRIDIDNALIGSYTFTSGSGGLVRLSAENVNMSGGARIVASAAGAQGGNAGAVEINARGSLSLTGRSAIDSSTESLLGHAGDIAVTARAVSLDASSLVSSSFLPASTGKAGAIRIQASDDIALGNNSQISTSTLSRGDGGAIRLAAANISVSGSDIISSADAGSSGKAGSIELLASKRFAMTNDGVISTNTYASGDAGAIKVEAGTIALSQSSIVSAASTGSLGQAGSIQLLANDGFEMTKQSQVSTSTLALGDGGLIRVGAKTISLTDSQIFSEAGASSQGNAGSIEVKAVEDVHLRDSSVVTNTFGVGTGGTILLRGRDIVLEGISNLTAEAYPGSGGQTGNLSVEATRFLSLGPGSLLAIRNGATVANPKALKPTLLSLRAQDLLMVDAYASAASFGNVDASAISISASGATRLGYSTIETSANQGNGGPISLQTGGLLILNNTALTTSVSGTQGNGGNITVTANTLLMETGFIQANTAAANASGGLVQINVNALLTSGNTLFVGGSQPLTFQLGVFGFNVIQAAAPTGVSGVIAITSPVLDLSGSLVLLNAQMLDAGGLGRNPCQNIGGSSLASGGRGGLAPSARGPLSASSSNGTAIASLLPPVQLSLLTTVACL